jgi:type IV pilus assembly protein PilW
MITFKIKNQHGFTLIELMIGLVLGLIASLAIFSTISTFESQRRATGSGADMQQSGLFSLYSIEQDVRLAGFGLINASTKPGSLPCTRLQPNNLDIAPVTLTDGGTGSDTIAMHRLDSNIGGMVTGGQAAMILTSPLPVTPTLLNISVDTTQAIHPNDYLLVPGQNLLTSYDCFQIKATSLPVVAPAPQPASMGSIINLGNVAPAFFELSYSVNASFDLVQSSSQLDSTNPASPVWGSATANPLASNIVNLQAQYGVSDPANPGAGLCWTDATGTTACPATTPTPGADWSAPPAIDIKRIQAIRVAVVARNAEKASSCTATTAPVSYATLAAKSPVGIDNWGWGGCYRYKVYQTIIPIRNVIWGNL